MDSSFGIHSCTKIRTAEVHKAHGQKRGWVSLSITQDRKGEGSFYENDIPHYTDITLYSTDIEQFAQRLLDSIREAKEDFDGR